MNEDKIDRATDGLRRVADGVDGLEKRMDIASRNTSWGYHGTVEGESEDERAKKYKEALRTVQQVTGCTPSMARDYLDSKHGRHLADQGRLDPSYIKRDFQDFKKRYDPKNFK